MMGPFPGKRLSERGFAPLTGPTGNYLVVFEAGLSISQQTDLLRGTRGYVAVASDFRAARSDFLSRAETPVLLNNIGVARLLGSAFDTKDRVARLKDSKGVKAVVPEYFVSIEATEEDISHRQSESDSGAHRTCTWGVEAVGACTSDLAGRNIRLAVVDTGFDHSHPDFASRNIRYWSAFGCKGYDNNGHGTHCAGTAAGPRAAGTQRRYGVAPDAELHVYKVLDHSGNGRDFDILAGIDQAIFDGCEVISMSLCRDPVSTNGSSPAFDAAGQSALNAGSLIIAAAGNSSSRHKNIVAPIAEPASSPTIMAVAAVDRQFNVADFSAAAPIGNRGIDIAGPGVEILSSVPGLPPHLESEGTSTAVPHVAGVACLWAEKDPSLRGRALWRALVSAAKPLSGLASDVGAGLVCAP
jgi:subtilisin family serine protease